MKITEADTAGWRIETPEQTYYVGEYTHLNCNEGVIYKDFAAFKRGKGVCYINEYGFNNSNQNAGELFEFAAKQAVAEELADNPYIADSGYTRQDFEDLVAGTRYSAEELFDCVDWQAPETLLDEWQQDDDEQGDTDLQERYADVLSAFKNAREDAICLLTLEIADGACIEMNDVPIVATDRYGYRKEVCRLHYIRREGDNFYVYLLFEELNGENQSGEWNIDDRDDNELYQIIEWVYKHFNNN